MYYSFALAGHRGTCLRPLHIFALLFCFALLYYFCEIFGHFSNLLKNVRAARRHCRTRPSQIASDHLTWHSSTECIWIPFPGISYVDKFANFALNNVAILLKFRQRSLLSWRECSSLKSDFPLVRLREKFGHSKSYIIFSRGSHKIFGAIGPVVYGRGRGGTCKCFPYPVCSSSCQW